MTDLSFYADMQETAGELLNDFGFSGQLIKNGSTVGDYDDDGTYIPPVAGTIIDCLITPVMDFSAHEIDGESVLNGDGMIYIKSDTAPEIGMTTTIDGDQYRLIKDIGMSTNTGDVLYRAWQIRGDG